MRDGSIDGTPGDASTIFDGAAFGALLDELIGAAFAPAAGAAVDCCCDHGAAVGGCSDIDGAGVTQGAAVGGMGADGPAQGAVVVAPMLEGDFGCCCCCGRPPSGGFMSPRFVAPSWPLALYCSFARAHNDEGENERCSVAWSVLLSDQDQQMM